MDVMNTLRHSAFWRRDTIEAGAHTSTLRRVVRVFQRWPIVSTTILVVILLVAIFAPVVAPYNPSDHSLRDRNLPPMWMSGGGANHVLGTDTLGRDLLSRLIFGARISMLVAGIALSTGILIGTTLGFLAGYLGRFADEVITRFVDIWLGFPFILVALVVSLAIGPGVATIAMLLALLAWTQFVRQVRGEILSLREREYVFAARIAGASIWRIFLRHMVPGVMSTVLVIATFQIASLILVEAFLSFLGAGIPPPTPAWGNMIAEGRNYLQDAWWISFFPGLAILLTTASLSFLGDWLRDFNDPHLRNQR